MVVHLEEWQCETCKKKYPIESDAIDCEKVVPTVYPVGCMYSGFRGWLEDTFAVSNNRIIEHKNIGGSWWSRDQHAHRKLVGHEHTCSDGSGELSLGRSDKHVELELPSCKRMVEWLESQGITPTVWDGTKAISLEEAREYPEKRWRYSDGFGTHPRRRSP
jgi:hypothetical protein